MELSRKIIVLSIILISGVLPLGALPSFAKIDGTISKGHFYDTDKTIMTEVVPNKTLTTGKYWEKNLLYANKYSPLFMLSNKELYDLMPKENVSVVQRITTPCIYNISLKNSSIKRVALNPSQPTSLLVPTSEKTAASQVSQTKVLPEATNATDPIYEQAKNPDVELDKKVNAAILLKDSKKSSNYGLAIDLLDDVTKKEPYNAYAFYLKGELYAKQKDSGNAMKNYVEALKINPTSKQSCLGIAKILEPKNKELAQKYYDRAK